MRTIRFISILIIVLIAGGWLAKQSLTIHIPLGKAGVRVQQYGVFGKKGLVARDFGPGWHRNLGPIDTWELYDTTVQTLEMTKDPLRGSRTGRDDVKVQSADGYGVSVDVTVKFRIVPGQVFRLYQTIGKGTKYMTIVRNETESACVGLFGLLKTEDFYNPVERRQTADAVKEALAEKLVDKSMEVIDVLIREVEFDPEYENKIRRKKLADQEVEVNISEAEAERKSGQTQVIEAETKKLVDIITKEKEAELIRMEAEANLTIAKIEAGYERYAQEKKADADLVAALKGAEGQRLLKVAEAEGERLRNEALAGAGGSVIVALEAAKNLNLSDVTISTMEVDLLDINKMATKLGVEEE